MTVAKWRAFTTTTNFDCPSLLHVSFAAFTNNLRHRLTMTIWLLPVQCGQGHIKIHRAIQSRFQKLLSLLPCYQKALSIYARYSRTLQAALLLGWRSRKHITQFSRATCFGSMVPLPPNKPDIDQTQLLGMPLACLNKPHSFYFWGRMNADAASFIS